ncbi:MAG: RIP metalloprotease RseP [Bacillota bacterium]|nr:RIP metalloprotease RseP [Bacillota bacterium]
MSMLLGGLLPVLAFIFVLGLLVLAHELGHFAVAKGVGIKVEEFALGMGPRLLAVKGRETVYSVRLLPLGGFCRMAGEDAAGGALSVERMPPAERERQFGAKPPGQRALVLTAGPVMNFILAGLVYAVLFGSYGIPVAWVEGAVVGDVSPGTPAAEAGLLPQDRILSVNGVAVRTWEEMAALIERSPRRPVELVIRRPGRAGVLRLTVTPQRLPRPDRPEGIGFIGVIRQSDEVKRVGPGEALRLGFLQAWHVLVAMLGGLWQLVTGKVAGPLTGPVGIARMTGQAARYGFNSVLELTAFLSINLGIINLLPIPALDGGRLVFLGVEVVRRRPVNPEREGFIHFLGFALLMLFLMVVTLKDLERLLFPMRWR